jgi:hypothetical protein
METALTEVRRKRRERSELAGLIEQFLGCATWLESKRFFQVHQSRFMSEEAENIVATLLETAGNDKRLETGLREFRNLIRVCQTDGIDLAFARRPVGGIVDATLRLIEVGTWEETRQLMEVQPDIMLSEEVLRAIWASARLKENKGEGERFKQHAALLEECRSEGIETAFAKLSGSKMYITAHELLGGNEGKNNTAVKSGDEIAQLENTGSLLRQLGPSSARVLGGMLNTLGIAYLERKPGDREENSCAGRRSLQGRAGVAQPRARTTDHIIHPPQPRQSSCGLRRPCGKAFGRSSG